MYSIVLATLLTAGTAAPDAGWGCHGCYGYCYGACYGVCYGGWAGCWGCSGCYGCSGCWGCSGCYGGCSGCWGCNGCFGGWSCHGCNGCYGGCYGSSCHGCCGGWSCHGCNGCYGGAYSYAVPAVNLAPVMPPAINGGHAPPAPNVLPLPSGGEVKLQKKMPAIVVIKAATDVKITVNGQETKRLSEVQPFDTPDLVVGKTYSYQIGAEVVREGRTYATSKRVLVKAGERTEVDFGDMSAVIAEEQAKIARITVILPKGGKLFVDGQEQAVTTTEQTFETPRLVKGKSYFYVLKVELPPGKDKTVDFRAKRVSVEAGKEVTVDFRSLFVAQH